MRPPTMALIALGLSVSSPHASACSDEIAQLEKATSEKVLLPHRQRRNRSARSSGISQRQNRSGAPRRHQQAASMTS